MTSFNGDEEQQPQQVDQQDVLMVDDEYHETVQMIRQREQERDTVSNDNFFSDRQGQEQPQSWVESVRFAKWVALQEYP